MRILFYELSEKGVPDFCTVGDQKGRSHRIKIFVKETALGQNELLEASIWRRECADRSLDLWKSCTPIKARVKNPSADKTRVPMKTRV